MKLRVPRVLRKWPLSRVETVCVGAISVATGVVDGLLVHMFSFSVMASVITIIVTALSAFVGGCIYGWSRTSQRRRFTRSQ